MTPNENELPVIIIGAGIGGLTLALHLGQRGIPCTVLEQADDFNEFGAGLQLSPNAIRHLWALGLEKEITATASAPDKIIIHDALNGSYLNEVPLGPIMNERYGAPYLVIARQDLQSILLKAIEAIPAGHSTHQPNVQLKLGQKFVTYTQNETTITAEMENGDTVTGRLLIGADGIWSRVRHQINKDAIPTSTGLIAWRAMVDSAQAPDLFKTPNTQVWLGPDAHLVHYQVSNGEKLNLVAVTKGHAKQRSWSESLPKEQLFETTRPWDKTVRSNLMQINQWTAWPLMILRPFHPWYKRRMLVMGDAAHAVPPFLAQGAAMAIEDAAMLSTLIADHNQTIEQVPPLFENKRFKRCQRVLSKSIYNCQFYHARAGLRHIRNFGLKRMPTKFLLRQYDWLYKA